MNGERIGPFVGDAVTGHFTVNNSGNTSWGEAHEPVAEREASKIRTFQVEQLNYGYIVTVGCHKFAIESHSKVSALIAEYLANPDEVEKKWFANEFELKRCR